MRKIDYCTDKRRQYSTYQQKLTSTNLNQISYSTPSSIISVSDGTKDALEITALSQSLEIRASKMYFLTSIRFVPFLSFCAATRAAVKPITLLTFDVDGTLVKGSGASAETSVHANAFSRSLGRIFGNEANYELTFPSPLARIRPEHYHGSTDGLIALHYAKAAFQIPPNEALLRLPEVFQLMYEYVASKPDHEVVRGIAPLPGVLSSCKLLASSQYRDHFKVGLVTGNVEGIARVKMKAVGIFATGCLSPPSSSQSFRGHEEYAFLGGFGSDYCSGNIDDVSYMYRDRGEQICIAYNRACQLLKENEVITRVIHIGDAPGDVLAAKMCAEESRFGENVQVGCIAVATGKFTAEELTALVGEPIPGVWEPIVLKEGINDPLFLHYCGASELVETKDTL